MQTPPKINSKIISITVFVTVSSMVALMLMFWAFSVKLQAAVLILTGFVFFVLSVIALYYFYHVFLTRHFMNLNEAIRSRLFSNEIPRLQNQLDDEDGDRKSTRLNSSHIPLSRMPSSA